MCFSGTNRQCGSKLKGWEQINRKSVGCGARTKLLVFALNLLGSAPIYLVNLYTKAKKLIVHLLKAALLRFLVRPPAQESGAVAKAAAGEVIKLNFNYEFR